jgi:acyl-coenzyme A thioesterase PaaI-like protein
MSGMLEITAERFQQIFIDSVPHHRLLNFSVKAFSLGRVAYSMPYDESLASDPATGAMHEFAIFTLMDAVCAAAAQTRLGKTHRNATLNLRTDFIRNGRGQAIIGEAECLQADGNIATVRAIAHEGDPGDPLVIATGAFAIIPLRPVRTAA